MCNDHTLVPLLGEPLACLLALLFLLLGELAGGAATCAHSGRAFCPGHDSIIQIHQRRANAKIVAQYCPYGLTHVRVPIFGNKKGDITSLNQLGILGELFSEFAFALHKGIERVLSTPSSALSAGPKKTRI